MKHTLHDHKNCHARWDNSLPPALTIQSGEQVELHMREASDGQVDKHATKETIKNLDPARANPVTGPIYIDGAKPGDALKVTVQELFPSGWGWTAIIPGFGLLTDDFPDAALHLWNYNKNTLAPAAFNDHARVPLKPFIGTIGLAPAQAGSHSTIPPRRVGGNMDLRDISVGAEVILPVECDGALFSAGDTHAAQGDGEVCGTAIESPLNGVFKFELIKDAAPASPLIMTNEPSSVFKEEKGYWITTGIGPDIWAAIECSVKHMIDLLASEQKLSPTDAYMLISVCADLRISQIVDAPNWTIALYFPRMVFE